MDESPGREFWQYIHCVGNAEGGRILLLPAHLWKASELRKNTTCYYSKVNLCGMTLEFPEVTRPDFWLTKTSLLWLCTIVVCTFTYYRQCMRCSCVYGRQQHQDFLSAGHAADKDSQHADPKNSAVRSRHAQKIFRLQTKIDALCFNCYVFIYFNFSILSIPATYEITVAVRSNDPDTSRAWMSVCRECCVLSGTGLCDELIILPEEFYWLWCVVLWSRNLKNWEAMARVGSQPKRGGGEITPCHNLTTDKWPVLFKKIWNQVNCVWGFTDQFPGAISSFITLTIKNPGQQFTVL